MQVINLSSIIHMACIGCTECQHSCIYNYVTIIYLLQKSTRVQTSTSFSVSGGALEMEKKMGGVTSGSNECT